MRKLVIFCVAVLSVAVSRAQAQTPVYAPAPTYAPVYQPVYRVPAATAYADVNGFVAWLNGQRAQYGLPAVGYDQNLSNWAAANNTQQNARGIGHYVMGPARRQNAAMAPFVSIGQLWMNSPGHRAAMLDPTIRWIGLAGSGMYWTMNAR
jgi:uncharacterized protein YkwD